MLGCIPWPGPLMSQALLHKGLGGMCGSTPSVETPQIFDTCPDQGGGHYGYPARVGSHPQLGFTSYLCKVLCIGPLRLLWRILY